MEEALRLSQKYSERGMEAWSLTLLGRILGRMEIPQIHKAEEYILQGMKISDEMKEKAYCALGYFSLGELYANAGQKKMALENLRKAESMFQEMGMDYWLGKAQEELKRLGE
jgi:tetratricopeptide (TPR) repeat protein